MPGDRLKGQEVSIRVINAGIVVNTIDSIGAFNEEAALEIKENGYLGEMVNRFDEVFNGFGGDFDFHVHRADWLAFQLAVIDRASRRTPAVQFNVVRVDFFPNGDSNTYTYVNVKWGGMPTAVASRGDFVQVKANFKCSERPTETESVG
jgi:hypothetical protein